MKLGTAKITKQDNGYLVTYLNSGSFLKGERWYVNENEARLFCIKNGLRIVTSED